MPNLNKVTPEADMSSSKVWVTLLALMCFQCRMLAHSTGISKRQFMNEYYLSSNWNFDTYKCDAVMLKKRIPRDQNSHVFVYISWYQLEHLCIRNHWNDRYRNTYVWTPSPIKVLTCHRQRFKIGYTESRSFNYVEFHCNMDGYVNSIEDMKLVALIDT
ncbi:epididymal secretory protein E3-beta [Ochotona princeps]|uniref:epididymal secretory protein E3-beta n=1 Tax=Ochotona princeps TaxID=9978 RepID=UPI002714E22F|nr:epididymal secretory protein E3-beta [Ochotona princeps]